MYIVTGGMGFIGSNIVRKLNDNGIDDILVVDDAGDGDKFRNLSTLRIADYMDREEFRYRLENGLFREKAEALFHEGACAVTTERDAVYMLDNNFTFSKLIFEYAVAGKIPLVYASSAAVYGSGKSFLESPANEAPINIYGYSKLLFDQYVRKNIGRAGSPVAGLRYFNVFGPGEFHKGAMASMVYQCYLQLKANDEIRLFEGTGGFGDGEQRRDFVFVEDVVNINLYLASAGDVKGIFNVGTGKSRSFNDIAGKWISLMGGGNIRYIPVPENIKGRYQSFTEADTSSLLRTGYLGGFTGLEEGIEKYYRFMEGKEDL